MPLPLTYILSFGFIILSPLLLLAQESTYTNSIGMEFVLIKPGSMIVGKFQPTYPQPPHANNIQQTSRSGLHWTQEEYKLAEEMANRDATPGFRVKLDHPYYIGKFEVTQAQWKKVMGNNPSIFQGNKIKDSADQHPVDNITWQDVQKFLKKLNKMEKGKVYRLPTEFEWEYAARAGAEDDIPWAEIRLAAWIMDSDKGTTHIVGQKKPNAWGLYDMLGNVWEWVQDYYNEKMFADPVPPASGKEHILKGASFIGDVKNATYLTHAAGPANKWDVGFRIIMEVK